MPNQQTVVRATLLSALIVFLLTPICPAQVDGRFARIVINDDDGPVASRQFAEQFDAVVSLNFQGESFCTGSLVAPDTVLTARHCLTFVGDDVVFGEDSNNPEFTTTVASVTDPAGDEDDLLDGGDVAILRLSRPVPLSVAAPLRLTSETASLVGRTAVTVGYGLNGVGSVGHQDTTDGRRWAGTNVIDTFDRAAGPGFLFEDTTNIFSTDFDNGTAAANTISGSDPTPSELEATTAPGDSGGPLLVESNGEWLIAGVLSGGTTDFSTFGDISWWTGIAAFRTEIEAAGGVFATSTVPEPSAAVLLAFGLAPLAKPRGRVRRTQDGRPQ